ncbi:Ice nucleation protein [Pseudomonas aeruginosa]|nr:Ice nucleation protein [Pseudomonas aeruginosa]
MTTKAKTKKQGTALILRTCSADLTSHGGFQWPDKIGAVVEAPDWKKDNKCGHGLHGWLFGQGDHDCSSTVGDADAKWLVVEVGLSDLIALGGKVKFPRCTVRHIGDKASATQFLIANEPRAAGVAVIGATLQAGDKELCQVGAYGTATAGDWGTATAGNEGTATAGYKGTATAGYKGTATAGNEGTATAGNEGTATAGNEGTATAGYKGTATAGNEGTATAGYKGTATAGNEGTATAGYKGTATAGNEGTATAGYKGTATAGDWGTATAGNEGTATAGKKGEIQIRYWDEKTERYRTVIGYIGEDGLEPGVAYKLDDNHRFVKAGG